MGRFCSWQLNGEQFTQQHAELIAYYRPDIICLQGVDEQYVSKLTQAIGYRHACFNLITSDLGTAIISDYALGDAALINRSRMVAPQIKYVALSSGMITIANVWQVEHIEQDYSLLEGLTGPLVVASDGLNVEFDVVSFRYRTKHNELARMLLSETALGGLGDAYMRFVAMRPTLRYMLSHIWPEGPIALASVECAQSGSPVKSFIHCNDAFRVVNAAYEFIESCAVGACASLIISELTQENSATNDTKRLRLAKSFGRAI